MSLMWRREVVKFLVMLGTWTPLWWIRDAVVLAWPELDNGGILDVSANVTVTIVAVLTALLVQKRLVEPTLMAGVTDEP